MAPNATLEQRVLELEKAVAELQRQRLAPGNWLERFVGSVTDLEAFEEALRLGREYREEQRAEESAGENP
jgi:hypothetical protein